MEEKFNDRNLHLKLINGGLLSGEVFKAYEDIDISSYNIRFLQGRVTDTRLMGAIVVSITWLIDTTPDFSCPKSFRQYFYIGIEEGGFDTYRSCFADDTTSVENAELSLSGGLGGKWVPITEKEARYLIFSFGNITANLGIDLPEGIREYGFLLEEEVAFNSYDQFQLMKKMCVEPQNKNEVINYFLMRFFSHDMYGARFLTTESEEIFNQPHIDRGTLHYNKIEFKGRYKCNCTSLIETNSDYVLIHSEILIRGSLVEALEINHITIITSEEAALILNTKQSFFHIKLGRESFPFNSYTTPLVRKADISDFDIGTMYMIYKDNNDHVRNDTYYINDDVLGLYFYSSEGDLIVFSPDRGNLDIMKSDLEDSIPASSIVYEKLYTFDYTILLDYMTGTISSFDEFIKIGR